MVFDFSKPELHLDTMETGSEVQAIANSSDHNKKVASKTIDKSDPLQEPNSTLAPLHKVVETLSKGKMTSTPVIIHVSKGEEIEVIRIITIPPTDPINSPSEQKKGRGKKKAPTQTAPLNKTTRPNNPTQLNHTIASAEVVQPKSQAGMTKAKPRNFFPTSDDEGEDNFPVQAQVPSMGVSMKRKRGKRACKQSSGQKGSAQSEDEEAEVDIAPPKAKKPRKRPSKKQPVSPEFAMFNILLMCFQTMPAPAPAATTSTAIAPATQALIQPQAITAVQAAAAAAAAATTDTAWMEVEKCAAPRQLTMIEIFHAGQPDPAPGFTYLRPAGGYSHLSQVQRTHVYERYVNLLYPTLSQLYLRLTQDYWVIQFYTLSQILMDFWIIDMAYNVLPLLPCTVLTEHGTPMRASSLPVLSRAVRRTI